MDVISIKYATPVKTIVVFIIFIYIVIIMNKHFFDIYDHILTNTDDILTNNGKYKHIK